MPAPKARGPPPGPLVQSEVYGKAERDESNDGEHDGAGEGLCIVGGYTNTPVPLPGNGGVGVRVPRLFRFKH